MTTIEFNLHDADTVDPDLEVSTAPSGFAYVQPFRDGLDVETYALLKTQREVTITDGIGSVEVDAAATRYWYVWFKITGYTTRRHLFDVPTSGTVTYRDLRQTYEVDPATLVAVPAGAAWELADAVEEAARIAADGVLTAAVALKANAANPVFTGTVTVPDGALAIADTSGLQAALDAKAATAHTHPQADVTGLVAALAAVTPGAWADLVGTGGLAKFATTAGAPPQYRLWAGEVYLAGRFTITGGSGMTSGEHIFTLPALHRPPLNRWIEGRKQDWGAVLLLCTAATGVVTAPTSGAATSIDLDGVRFRV